MATFMRMRTTAVVMDDTKCACKHTLGEEVRCRKHWLIVLQGWRGCAPECFRMRALRNVERSGATGHFFSRSTGEQTRTAPFQVFQLQSYAGRPMARAGGARVRHETLPRKKRRPN